MSKKVKTKVITDDNFYLCCDRCDHCRLKRTELGLNVGALIFMITFFLAILSIIVLIFYHIGADSAEKKLVNKEERYEYLIEHGTSPDLAADIVYGDGDAN